MSSKSNLTLDGQFYPTYKKSKTDFDDNTFECAETTVSNLLATATTSEHPGMLLGKVQSGKTRAFITILALAFDNGFDIAIVLSKNSKALIEQTTKRLNSEFSSFVDDQDLEIYDIMHAPSHFGKFELDSKLLFVAKKQKDNLNRLIDLISESCPDMRNKRILIIDDEADNASVGYSKNKETKDIDANTIAKQISNLRSHPEQVSFLQVTATPYSLYLQPENIKVSNDPDFRPTRPAFTVLVPVPSAYVGGDTYFGEKSRSEEPTLESLIHYSVDHNEFDRLKKQDRRAVKEGEALTSKGIAGYRQAIVTFIVGGCIQRINKIAEGQNQKKLRYSLLLHSEATKGAHVWQEKLTGEILDQFTEAHKNSDSIFKDLIKASYDDLKRSLALDNQNIPSLENVIAEVGLALTDDFITVTKVNSDEDVSTMLDNSGQLKLRSPLHIFIGGQVLDRGVTLANLIGFYYGRRPNKSQQDTVLQHSRMFGYRRAELAVTRFYTSRPIRSGMVKMEEFDTTLREAIEAKGDQKVQFIRKSSDGKIVPCSPNKILVSASQTLKPYKRLLPIGFQSGYKSGKNGIGEAVNSIDLQVEKLCGFNSKAPVLVSLQEALDLIHMIEPTLVFGEDSPAFDWSAYRDVLLHLAQLNEDKKERNKVWLWAAKDRNSARMAGQDSHSTFIETPDSPKTEGKIARKHANDHPILFLLRQNGTKNDEWRGAPFYWPVIHAQSNVPVSVYTSETI